MNLTIDTLEAPIRGLKAPLTVYHITDSHLCLWDERDHAALQEFARGRDAMFSNGHPGMLEACFREMLRIAQDGDAIILTGDIIDFPGAANVDALGDCLKDNHVPLLYTYGNHDPHPHMFAPEDEPARQANLAKLKTLVPTDPEYDHLDVGGIRFVGLDNGDRQLTPQQLEKLTEDLACGMPVVLCMHIPMFTQSLYEPTWNFWRSAGLFGRTEGVAPEFLPNEYTRAGLELLKNSPNFAAVLAGDIHFSHDDDLAPGLRQYVGANGAMRYMRRIHFVPAE